MPDIRLLTTLRLVLVRLLIVCFCAFVGTLEGQTTEVASDDFDRPDGDLGTNWGYPIATETTFVISNDLVTTLLPDCHTEACWTSNSFCNNQYSQMQLTSIGAWTGLVLRADTNVDEFYLGFVFDPNNYRIYARYGYTNAYQYFSLATGTQVTWHIGDIMKMTVSGSNDPVTVTMYQNGTPVLVWRSFPGSDYLPVKNGGSPGIGMYSPGGDSLTLGDWQGGNLNVDTNPPSTPANLFAAPDPGYAIDLGWSASTDDVGVVAYEVDRSVGAGSTNFEQIGVPLGTTFTDVQLTEGATNNYRVMAVDAAGNASPCSEATAIVPVPPLPNVSTIPNQTTLAGTPVGPFPFSISDVFFSSYALTVTGTSSNTNLVPNQNISISNQGSTQILTIIPAAGQTGTSMITINVSNGENSTNACFLLTVNPPGNGTDVFANSSNIMVCSQSGTVPYPSTVNVSGEQGVITNVTVTFYGMSYNNPRDLNALLVSPGGQAVVLMSDAIYFPMNNITFTLSDQAYYQLPYESPLEEGNYQPTDYAPDHIEPAYAFPFPAPVPPYSTGMSSFDGVSPNGTWSLYLSDAESGDSGQIAGGWSLAVTMLSPPLITGLTNQSTYVNTPTAAIPFEVEDTQTPASNLVLAAASSNPALVNPATDIVIGGSGTNSTITITPELNTIGASIISVIATDSGGMSSTNNFLMTVNQGQLTVGGITASNKVYDGTTAAALNPSGANLTGQGLNGSDATLDTTGATGTFTDPNVGTNKTIQISGLTLDGNDAGNYVLNQPTTTANITSVTLTVTAMNNSQTYGLPSPPLTACYSGFVNGEGTNVLTGVPALSTTATTSSPPGVYPITASAGTLSATNYSFNFVSGNLTVVALPQLSTVALSSGQLVFTWPTLANQTYEFESTTNLYPAVWTPIGGAIVGTGDSVLVTNTPGNSPQFYRLSITQ